MENTFNYIICLYSLQLYHSPQTACLHPAVSCAAEPEVRRPHFPLRIYLPGVSWPSSFFVALSRLKDIKYLHVQYRTTSNQTD